MDMVYKEMCEAMSTEQLVNMCLEQKNTIDGYKLEVNRLLETINSKQFLIDTLLKVIKYQNGLND